jgi:hypothetical protein
MPVSIKELTVDVECLNNKAVDVAVYAPNAQTFRGDLIITSAGLEWRDAERGKSRRGQIPWEKFIDWMNS